MSEESHTRADATGALQATNGTTLQGGGSSSLLTKEPSGSDDKLQASKINADVRNKDTSSASLGVEAKLEQTNEAVKHLPSYDSDAAAFGRVQTDDGADESPLVRDYWNQSMRRGVVYDRDSSHTFLQEFLGATQAEEDEARFSTRPPIPEGDETAANNDADRLETNAEEDEDEDEDDEDDDHAIDEVIGLDEEFADASGVLAGASRMEENRQQDEQQLKEAGGRAGAPVKQSGASKTSSNILLRYPRRSLSGNLSWATIRMAIRMTIALGFMLGAILVEPAVEWASIAAWRWLTFCAVVVFAFDFCAIVLVSPVLFVLSQFWQRSKSMKNAHYYLIQIRNLIALLLASVAWILTWWLVIGIMRPSSSQTWAQVYDYVTRGLGSIVLMLFLITVAALAKEIAESVFERTTHWSDVERMLKSEYFLWRLSGVHTILPHEVVVAYVLAGVRETRGDPKVLRQCTRYISKSPMTAYDVPAGEFIPLRDMEDAGDFGEILFDRVAGTLAAEEIVERLKAMRATRETRSKTTHFRAYGYMMGGRTRLVNPIGGGIDSSADGSVSFASPPSSKVDQNQVKPGLKQGKDKSDTRRVTFEGVQKVYDDLNPRYTPPEFAPDAQFGWARILDVSHRGHGSKRSFRAAMIRFYQDRVNVAATLRDAHAAVERLGMVMLSVACVMGIIFTVLIFAGSSSYDVWLGLTSFFVAIAVVFGGMLAQVFESIVFLFVRHPYDVGDLIVIDNDYYSVRRLELLSCLLLKWSGQYLLCENSWLSKQQVFNLTRSGLYWHAIDTVVDIATCTPEFLHGVRQCVKQFIAKHPRSFSGEFQVSLSDMQRPLHVVVSLWIEFSYRPNNLERLFTDIGKSHEAICHAMRTMGATSSGVPRASIHIGKAPAPKFISTAPDEGLVASLANSNSPRLSQPLIVKSANS